MQLTCLYAEVKVLCTVHSEHPVQPVLQPPVLIFQCQIEDGSFPDRILPEIRPSGHMVGKLQHEKTLSQFRSSDKKIGSRIEQAVYYGRS